MKESEIHLNNPIILKGPWRITFDTNPDLCNINCIICEENSKYNRGKKSQNRLMDFKIIEKVIKNSLQYGLQEIIPSTMGEPLLYPEFEKLIILIKKNNLKMNLTTNGTFPILGAEKWANLILPIASDVKISINGASKKIAENIMEGIIFEKQLENIRKFINIRDDIKKSGINNPTITFQVTYMDKNLNELPDLLKIAIDMNVDRFKGHHLWVTHPELERESLRRNISEIKKWNIMANKLVNISNNYLRKDKTKIKLDNVFTIDNLINETKVPEDMICPFLGREAWIAWNGAFNVCCAPDQLRKTLGYFGNVNESDFMDLWNSNEYQNLVKNWGKYNICNECNMRKPMNEVRWC